MLVVVVSFFSSIWFSRTESVLNAVSIFLDTKLLNTFFSTKGVKEKCWPSVWPYP